MGLDNSSSNAYEFDYKIFQYNRIYSAELGKGVSPEWH